MVSIGMLLSEWLCCCGYVCVVVVSMVVVVVVGECVVKSHL